MITKLKNKQQVFCNSIEQPDLEAAKKACEGQDYIWKPGTREITLPAGTLMFV